MLSDANRAALARVRAHALENRQRHLARIARVLEAAGEECGPSAVRAPVTLNFHPDRRLADGRSVAEALGAEGVYRNQFETEISSGGLTAYPGGDRDRWEDALFGGAYRTANAQERPKYGGLNLMRHLNGACAGFGSCHLRLRSAALERTTLIYGDSVSEPTDIGTIDAFEPVLAPLLERVAETGTALGRPGVDVRTFCDGLGAFTPELTHSLDDYVEAQVHGVVTLDDAAAIVIDGSFAGTRTGEQLVAAAERHGIAAEWLPALALPVTHVPVEAPGELAWQQFCANGKARRIAERIGPVLDAARIGEAAGAVGDLQHMKYLWRLVVVYGEPG